MECTSLEYSSRPDLKRKVGCAAACNSRTLQFDWTSCHHWPTEQDSMLIITWNNCLWTQRIQDRARCANVDITITMVILHRCQGSYHSLMKWGLKNRRVSLDDSWYVHPDPFRHACGFTNYREPHIEDGPEACVGEIKSMHQGSRKIHWTYKRGGLPKTPSVEMDIKSSSQPPDRLTHWIWTDSTCDCVLRVQSDPGAYPQQGLM